MSVPIPSNVLEYVSLSRRTAPKQSPKDMLINGALGLGEEFLEYLHATENEERKEAGDVCWYFASIIQGVIDGFNVDAELLKKESLQRVDEMTYIDPTWMLHDSIQLTIGKIKKHLFQGHDLDAETILVDCLSGLYVLENRYNGVWAENIAKLFKRYPEGFSKEKSINRVE